MLLSRMDLTVTFNVRGHLFDAITKLLSFHYHCSVHVYKDHKRRNLRTGELERPSSLHVHYRGFKLELSDPLPLA